MRQLALGCGGGPPWCLVGQAGPPPRDHYPGPVLPRGVWVPQAHTPETEWESEGQPGAIPKEELQAPPVLTASTPLVSRPPDDVFVGQAPLHYIQMQIIKSISNQSNFTCTLFGLKAWAVGWYRGLCWNFRHQQCIEDLWMRLLDFPT